MWWVKWTEDGRDLAQGPYSTESEAQACLDSRAEADDPGVLVEADLNYPHTLKHPVGKMATGEGQDNILYSDGSLEPIV